MKINHLVFLFLILCSVGWGQESHSTSGEAKAEAKKEVPSADEPSGNKKEKEEEMRLSVDHKIASIDSSLQPTHLRLPIGIYSISLCFVKEYDKDRVDVRTRASYEEAPKKKEEEETKDTSDEDICSLRPEIGICRAAFPMFYYNPSREECFEFTYGGCEGNANRFKTKEECQQRCKKIKPIIFP